MPDPARDPIPAEVRGVLALFRERLADVAFPDVDAARLAQLVDATERAAGDAERARLALRAAEVAADEALRALRAGALRGLAYARIYADDQPDRDALLAVIDALAAPAPTHRAAGADAPKRRGRPPKAASASLFSVSAEVGAVAQTPPRDEPASLGATA